MFLGLRWLAAVSTVTAVMAAGTPLLSGPLDWRNSVSYSWTRSRRKFLALAIVMSLAGVGISIGWMFWIIPHYHLPTLMYGVVAVAYVALMGVAWVPMNYRPGEHSYLHGHFLGGSLMATLAAIAMACVVWFGTDISVVTRIVSSLSMLLAASWPLLFFSPARKAFLVLESLVALSFFSAIMLLLS
jgi:hypothetical protein